MRKLIIVLICIVSLIAVLPVAAQDVNDPSNNWCFDGGPLEGKCGFGDTAESEWLWLYGFFRAQIAKGTLSVNDVPAEYQIGLADTAVGNTLSTTVYRDGNGNIIASGASADFIGYIVTCAFGDNNTEVIVGWQGLEVTGDRIEVGTPSGAGSASTFIPLSNTSFRLKFSDPVDAIKDGGTMNVFRDGNLIGTSELNGLSKCEDNT